MELLFNYTGLVKQYNMAETIFLPSDTSISSEILTKLLNPHNYHFLSCFLANHLFDNFIVLLLKIVLFVAILMNISI